MITLTIIGLSLKGLALLGLISTLILSGCEKQTGQCSICTVETMLNGSVLTTQTVEQTAREAKASGNCTSSQDEFRQGLVDEVTAQGLEANVTCKYE